MTNKSQSSEGKGVKYLFYFIKGLLILITVPFIVCLMVLDMFLILGGYKNPLTIRYLEKIL